MKSSDLRENLNIPPVANKERQVGIPFPRRKLKAVWTEKTHEPNKRRKDWKMPIQIEIVMYTLRNVPQTAQDGVYGHISPWAW